MKQQQKDLLLVTARTSLISKVTGSPESDPSAQLCDSGYGGLFVTLRRGEMLRGCMGTFHPSVDMIVTTREVTALAADDPRFRNCPLIPHELPEISIEISILNEPCAVADPLSLELGRHGIIIERGDRRGCFLPHVPIEYNWTKQEFLSRCCHDKARLEPSAWQDPQTRVLVFTAEVISHPAPVCTGGEIDKGE